jgi:four helix bundle protein
VDLFHPLSDPSSRYVFRNSNQHFKSDSRAFFYGEPQGAESARDFVRKLGIVLKELNESEVWTDMLVRRKTAEGHPILKIQEECKRLCRIIAVSVRTTNRNLGRTGVSKTQKPD